MQRIQATVALLPVSGTYVMTAEEAFEAAKVVRAEYYVPMHYGDIVGGEGDAEKFRYLCEEAGIRVAVVSISEDPS
jgi:L-ascorbate metabolism protein UlaG (beta-lactamase superfamily)